MDSEDDDYEYEEECDEDDDYLSEPFAIRGHKDSINCLALLPNGRFASASDDKTIKIWDLDTKSIVQTIETNEKDIKMLRVLPSGLLASVSKDCSIKIWNPSLDASHLVSSIGPIIGLYAYKMRIDVLSNGFLVCACWTSSESPAQSYSSVLVWDPLKDSLVKSIPGQYGCIIKALVVLANDQVAVGFPGGFIKIFDLIDETREPLIIHTEDDRGVDDLAQMGNGLLVSVRHNLSGNLSVIKVWNPRDGRLVLVKDFDQMFLPCRLAVSSDGRCLALIDSSSMHVWSLSVRPRCST